ncbi:RNA polymerase sigma factor [Paramuribaculum intestinale]|jgi:RNA polymerase sigma-70 factor (ECF subfamily)|uniref:RNA polymerase sigma factor n=1 Tax=Paramuribaculum intestinale TaxID=2094151 RepID=A0A2V1IV86_9BACT|nr:RNA polymerase sigma factor [Paramuribaculum intestinale]MBJ2186722.1 RNA polymerase sigma factor [Muribaculaceae bacterium]ROS93488.1 RNA polymerase sigma factor [Muribaculaceae bacterium Isolate-043 (Harlan)]ROT12506.1 RNA polymerase sigma factor [Muribaculaceae bacterium Isolate-105 (HZI)]MCX4329556.1 RNA polymerase sigma factor [Paramuribaculum intestinale]PWB07780.1 RNA polymerase sigma factor [Paramuribaculum intestinale]
MLTRFEEIKLLALCATTDSRNAFGRLVEEYEEPLRRFLYNLTGGDACLADDLAQDTFLKAYESVRSFKGLSGFRTWLYKIACNLYYSHLRSRRELTGLEVESYAATVSDAGQRASDASMDVATAMQALNPAERSLVLLFYLEDRSIKEITGITGMPEGTVKVYLKRAREKMAGVMGRG